MHNNLFFLLLLLPVIYGGTAIENQMRPTISPTSYLIFFSQSAENLVYSADYFQTILRVNFTHPRETPTLYFNITFLTTDFKIAQLDIAGGSISPNTKMSVYFPFTNPAGFLYFTESHFEYDLIPYGAISTKTINYVDGIGAFENILTYVWFIFAVLCFQMNPNTLIYFNGKLIMETLDMLSMANVNYDTFLNYFFVERDNKIAGIRAPNFFSVLLRSQPITSGYDREQSYDFNITDRLEDMKAMTFDRVLQFNTFALFLENYGIQIIIFAGLIVLVILNEPIMKLIFKKKSNTQDSCLYNFRISLRWSILIASFFGSYASGVFYAIAQIYSFIISPSSTYAIINFLVACFFILLFIGIPIYLWLTKVVAVHMDPEEESHKHLSLLFKPYRLVRKMCLFNTFYLIIRATVFAIITSIAAIPGLAQTAAYLVLSIAYTIYLFTVKPFVKKRDFVFQVIYEFFLMLYLIIIFVITILDITGTSAASLRSFLSHGLLIIWVLVPILAIGFSIHEIFIVPFCTENPKRTTKVTPDLPVKEKQTLKKETSIAKVETLSPTETQKFVRTTTVESPDPHLVRHTANTSVNHVDESNLLDQSDMPFVYGARSTMVRQSSVKFQKKSAYPISDDEDQIPGLVANSRKHFNYPESKILNPPTIQNEMQESNDYDDRPPNRRSAKQLKNSPDVGNSYDRVIKRLTERPIPPHEREFEISPAGEPEKRMRNAKVSESRMIPFDGDMEESIGRNRETRVTEREIVTLSQDDPWKDTLRKDNAPPMVRQSYSRKQLPTPLDRSEDYRFDEDDRYVTAKIKHIKTNSQPFIEQPKPTAKMNKQGSIPGNIRDEFEPEDAGFEQAHRSRLQQVQDEPLVNPYQAANPIKNDAYDPDFRQARKSPDPEVRESRQSPLKNSQHFSQSNPVSGNTSPQKEIIDVAARRIVNEIKGIVTKMKSEQPSASRRRDATLSDDEEPPYQRANRGPVRRDPSPEEEYGPIPGEKPRIRHLDSKKGEGNSSRRTRPNSKILDSKLYVPNHDTNALVDEDGNGIYSENMY